MRINIETDGTHGPKQYQKTCEDERPSGNITAAKIRQLLKWQNYKCAITGDPLTPDNCQADHIYPLARGGKNTMENVQLVIEEVNRAKGTLTMSEFIELCTKVAEHAE